MEEKKSPLLRTVDKVKPPYPLNKFPKDFGFNLGREIVYLLSTKGKPSLEGPEWEEIFALCIGAEWKPSNVGLDDVVMETCAWGAKTVKSSNPVNAKKIRLISGRNSPVFSFGEKDPLSLNTEALGSQIISIWNERVYGVRKAFKHLRTVVLVKSTNLDVVAVFEFETITYDSEKYNWIWNTNKNLEAHDKANGEHRFTWQPHGSQFTMIEDIPPGRLIVQIKPPPKLDKESILKGIGFKKDWITVFQKND